MINGDKTRWLAESLTMLIERKAGFEFTGADCSGWMRDAGFKETRVVPLCGRDFVNPYGRFELNMETRLDL